jgi:hypothetical protein
MEKQMTIEQLKKSFTKFGYSENYSVASNLTTCSFKKYENQIILNFLDDLMNEQDADKWKNILINKWSDCLINKTELEAYENALRKKY